MSQRRAQQLDLILKLVATQSEELERKVFKEIRNAVERLALEVERSVRIVLKKKIVQFAKKQNLVIERMAELVEQIRRQECGESEPRTEPLQQFNRLASFFKTNQEITVKLDIRSQNLVPIFTGKIEYQVSQRNQVLMRSEPANEQMKAEQAGRVIEERRKKGKKRVVRIQIEQAMEKIKTEGTVNWRHTQLKQQLQINELEWYTGKQIVKKTDFPYALFQYEAEVLDDSITRNDLLQMIVEREEALGLREDSWIQIDFF